MIGIKNNIKGSLILTVSAMIWGATFTAQSMGAHFLSAYSYNAIRYFLALLFIIPCIVLTDKFSGRKITVWGTNDRHERLRLAKYGFLAGLAITGGMLFQQIGIAYTTVGKAGFITALYIVMTPLLGLFIGNRISGMQWVCILMATAGLYFLSVSETLAVGKGELIIFFAAVCFAVHIQLIGRVAGHIDPLRLTAIDFMTNFVISSIIVLVTRTPDFAVANIKGALIPLFISAFLGSGIAHTLQPIGQKYTTPTVASMIMSMESVFALITGWLFLGELLSFRESIGCMLVFAAIIVIQRFPGK